MNQLRNFVTRFSRELSGLIFVFIMPALAFAQDGPRAAAQPKGLVIPTAGITSLGMVLDDVCIVFDWAFYFLIALAVFFVVVAAFKYLTSAGNPETVKSANNTLLYAAIAVAVALLARGIPLIVASFFGSADITSC